MASENVVEFTADNWEQDVLNSDKPVLVDFWAPHCMPCRQMNPVIDKIAESYAGRVKVGKLNTSDHQSIPVEYGVINIPRFLVFPGGGSKEPHETFIGPQAEKVLTKALDSVLESAGANTE